MTSIDLDTESTSLNQYFDQNGFSTTTLVRNLGSTFVYLTIYISLVSFYIILIPLSKIFKYLGILREYLRGKLFFNITFKFLFTQYPCLLISCLINTYSVDFSGEIIKTVSSVITVSLIIILPVAFFIAWVLIHYYKSINYLENDAF